MKIRTDFITNSSSSSFVVKLKEEIKEDGYNIKKITKDNLHEMFEDIFGWIGDVSYKYTNEQIKEMFGFSDEQLLVLAILKEPDIDVDDYIAIKNALEEEGYVYYISFDWCSPKEDEYRNIIRSGDIIFHES